MNDVGWILICAGLVFLMQPGFMCLESGLTRTKNSINVAVKNIADFGISVFLFWLFGYALMFGTSTHIPGWVGWNHFLPSLEAQPREAAFFLFEAMFCGTATTIVSGAVAERMRFASYVAIATLISGLIYPVFGHWAWNGLASGSQSGWLQSLGFVDFSGSTVVHSTGAWVSLAALLIIGPRVGRFIPGQSQPINGSNLPLSVLGTMLLWFGWLGFNSGSTFAFNDQIAGIMVHTVLAGVGGMLSMTAFNWWRYGLPQPESMINGSLAGLVSITASCHAVSTQEAVVIGAIGGLITALVGSGLDYFRIDDAVDAIAVHGGSGVWGTLAVALFGQSDKLKTGLLPTQQLLVQLLGIGVCFVWAFGVAYLLLWSINHWFPLRVSLDAEERGLNLAEHNAKTETYDLLRVMDAHSRTKDLSLRVPVDPFTEVGHIATRYNQVMTSLQQHAIQLENFNAQLEQTVQERTRDLAQANEDLKQLDRLKDDFLANTSHELRTPLNGIIGIAESLLDGVSGSLPEAANANLSLVVASGRRLASLVDDILDFSKLQHHDLVLNMKPLDLREIVDEVVALSQPLIGRKPLQVINTIPPGFPPVQADENRLRQILYNLLGNAIKFTPQGHVEVSASVELDEEARFLDQQAMDLQEPDLHSSGSLKVDPKHQTQKKTLITITDTGIGIPPEKINRIFESFEQGDGSVARQYGGTGLGLAITQKLVELHGGQITAESVLGQGSSFTFSLLMVDPAVALPEPTPDEVRSPFLVSSLARSIESVPVPSLGADLWKPQALSAASLPLTLSTPPDSDRHFKLLIVDDEPINLQVLQNHLAMENYAIAQASSGAEVFTLLEQGFEPDLILLDVMMPQMTGYEVTRKLRERFSANELPILMLTAKNQVSDLIEGLENGANDYLRKPISKHELLARIKTHLRLSNLNIAYSRFVPHEFLQLLNKESIIDVQLGDQTQKELSVLFSDIRNFTALSEQMSPADNFKFINAYLSRMEPAILENGGFIDKYIGDAIMALFPGEADQAVQAAISMLHTLIGYNQTRMSRGLKPVRIGIGINTGLTMLGTVGGKSHMDSTVISDTVNLAARIEELTKQYGVPLLISHDTLTRLQSPDQYAYRLLDQVKVRGRSASVSIFEVFDANPPELRDGKRQTKATFEQGVILLNLKRYDQAEACFLACLKTTPGDTVATTYLKRCRQERASG